MPRKRRRAQLAPGVRWTDTGYRVEIRDKRLDGGRMDIALRVANRDDHETANALAAAIRTMIDRGEKATERALRARKIAPSDVLRAQRSGDWSELRGAYVSEETIYEAVSHTLADIEATQEAGTLREYEVVGRLLAAHFGEGRTLASVTTSDAENFLREPKATIDDQTWSPNRQTKVAVTAGRIWSDADRRARDAAKESGIGHQPLDNPWKEAKLPKIRQTRVEWVRIEEWGRLLDVNRGKPVAAVLALACRAGLRATEILNLRPDIDVDMDARVVHVQHRPGAHEWRPKTDHGVRDIPMADELHAVVAEHIEAGYSGERYLIRAADSDGTAPMSYWGVLGWVKDAFAAAGLAYGREKDALTLHSLRHSFASHLAQQDVQILRIARLMGITVQVATATYVHLLPRDDRAAIDKVERALTTDKEGR